MLKEPQHHGCFSKAIDFRAVSFHSLAFLPEQAGARGWGNQNQDQNQDIFETLEPFLPSQNSPLFFRGFCAQTINFQIFLFFILQTLCVFPLQALLESCANCLFFFPSHLLAFSIASFSAISYAFTLIIMFSWENNLLNHRA